MPGNDISTTQASGLSEGISLIASSADSDWPQTVNSTLLSRVMAIPFLINGWSSTIYIFFFAGMEIVRLLLIDYRNGTSDSRAFFRYIAYFKISSDQPCTELHNPNAKSAFGIPVLRKTCSVINNT